MNILANLIINVWLVTVSGPDSLTRSQYVHHVVPIANHLMYPFQLRVVRHFHTREVGVSDRLDQDMTFGSCVAVADEHHWPARNRMVHFALPPYQYQGRKYWGGMALGKCYKKTQTVSMSNAAQKRTSGADGLIFSGIALAHESLHNLSAKHDTGLMDPDALRQWASGMSMSISPVNMSRMIKCYSTPS